MAKKRKAREFHDLDVSFPPKKQARGSKNSNASSAASSNKSTLPTHLSPSPDPPPASSYEHHLLSNDLGSNSAAKTMQSAPFLSSAFSRARSTPQPRRSKRIEKKSPAQSVILDSSSTFDPESSNSEYGATISSASKRQRRKAAKKLSSKKVTNFVTSEDTPSNDHVESLMEDVDNSAATTLSAGSSTANQPSILTRILIGQNFSTASSNIQRIHDDLENDSTTNAMRPGTSLSSSSCTPLNPPKTPELQPPTRKVQISSSTTGRSITVQQLDNDVGLYDYWNDPHSPHEADEQINGIDSSLPSSSSAKRSKRKQWRKKAAASEKRRTALKIPEIKELPAVKGEIEGGHFKSKHHKYRAQKPSTKYTSYLCVKCDRVRHTCNRRKLHTPCFSMILYQLNGETEMRGYDDGVHLCSFSMDSIFAAQPSAAKNENKVEDISRAAGGDEETISNGHDKAVKSPYNKRQGVTEDEIKELPTVDGVFSNEGQFFTSDDNRRYRANVPSTKYTSYLCLKCDSVRRICNRRKLHTPCFSMILYQLNGETEMRGYDDGVHLCSFSMDSIFAAQPSAAKNENKVEDISRAAGGDEETISNGHENLLINMKSPYKKTPVITEDEIKELPTVDGVFSNESQFFTSDDNRRYRANEPSTKYTSYLCIKCHNLRQQCDHRNLQVPRSPMFLYKLNGETEMRGRHADEHLCQISFQQLIDAQPPAAEDDKEEATSNEHDQAMIPPVSRRAGLSEDQAKSLPPVDGNFSKKGHVFTSDNNHKYRLARESICYTSYRCIKCEGVRRTCNRFNWPVTRFSMILYKLKGENVIRGHDADEHLCQILIGPIIDAQSSHFLSRLSADYNGNGRPIQPSSSNEPENDAAYLELPEESEMQPLFINANRYEHHCAFQYKCKRCQFISKRYDLPNPESIYLIEGRIHVPDGMPHLCDHDLDDSLQAFDTRLFDAAYDFQINWQQLRMLCKPSNFYNELGVVRTCLLRHYPLNGKDVHHAYIAFRRGTGTIKDRMLSIKWFGECRNLQTRANSHTQSGPMKAVFDECGELHFAPLLPENLPYQVCRNIEAVLLALCAIGKLPFKFSNLKNSTLEDITDPELINWTFNANDKYPNDHEILVKGFKQMIHAALRMEDKYISFYKK